MLKQYIIIILLLQIINPICIFSKEFTLKDIKVNKLQRTQYSTVLNIIDLKKGFIVDSSIVEDVEQKLLSAGIFQKEMKISFDEVSENEAILNIEIHDKWTLIPLPFGIITSDSWVVGCIFIESNLAGLNQALISGIFVNSENITGFTAWNSPNFLKSSYSFGLSGSVNVGSKEHLDITGENELATFKDESISISVRVGNELSLFNGLEWTIGTGLTSVKVSETTGYLENSKLSDLFWNNSLNLSWDNLFYSKYFNSGWYYNFKTSISSSTDYIFNPEISFKISKNSLINDKLLVKLLLNTGWQDNLDFDPIYLGGSEGSRALPSGDIAAKYYTDGMILFEPVILTPKWGSITTPLYYEAGIYQSLKSESNYWHGPGIGFRLYINKVAIPALGADLTWDFENDQYKFAVSIGASGS